MSDETADAIRQAAFRFDADIDGFWGPLFESIEDADVVLIGEATHGTEEFYRIRAELTKALIVREGFNVVAAEADWPDAYRVNRWVRHASGEPDAESALGDFTRFPRWMWRNTVVTEFITWLRQHNASREGSQQTGFYGLDLYSLQSSMAAVLEYLDKVDPSAATRARYRYACFEHYGEEPQAYGYAAAFDMTKSCEDEVVAQLVELRRRATDYANRDGRIAADDYFFAEQNAHLVQNAEQYYRAMFVGRPDSWNLRDTHMDQTLDALMQHAARTAGRARGGVGAQLSHWRCASDGYGQHATAESRTACAPANRAPGTATRIHDEHRHGDGGFELGRTSKADASASRPG
jgi:erythromycin esterase-like protein